MCTAISFNAHNHYFGRNLDLEYRYDESVVITPRKYTFKYRHEATDNRHFAFIGTATVIRNYPLYYDATNEYGLSIAGLNFVDNAYAFPNIDEGKINLAPYEIIPYVLSKCKNVEDAEILLEKIRMVDIRFNDDMPNATLHWMISDKKKSITFEYMKEGAKIHYNPVGVLTNNPPFEYHMLNLNNYMSISRDEPLNNFSDKIQTVVFLSHKFQ